MLPPSTVLTTKKRGPLPLGFQPAIPSLRLEGGRIEARGLRIALCLGLAASMAACTPSGPKALLRGEQLLKQGHYVEAAAMLERATKDIPEQAQAWNHLGLAYHKAGQKERALQAYTRALERNRNLEVVHYNLSRLHLEHGEIPAAIESLTRYLIHNPDASESWLQLGLCHLRLRQWDAAERALLAHLRYIPKSPEALNALGLIQVNRRKYREAYTHFHAASQARPGYAAASLNMGTVAMQFLNYRTFGIQKYREFLSLNPQSPHAAAVKQLLQQIEPETNLVQRLAPPPATNQLRAAVVAPAMPTNPPTLVAAATNPPVRNPTPPPVIQATSSVSVPSQPKTNVAASVPALPSPLPVKEVVPAEEDLKLAAAPAALPETKPTPQEPIPARPQSSDPETQLGEDPGKNSERTGFFNRLNPQTWFKKSEKPPTPLARDPSPRKVPATPSLAEATPPSQRLVTAKATPPSTVPLPASKVSTPNRPAVQQPPPPVYERYKYVNPPAPKPGDRPAAEKAFALGAQAQEQGKLTDAISHYRASAQSDPSYFEAWFNLAIASGRLGNSLASLEAYERALASQPHSLTARFNFALALQRSNFPDDAVAELTRLSADFPKEGRIHFALGNVHAQMMRRPDLARPHYSRVLELEPQHPQSAALRQWLAQNP